MEKLPPIIHESWHPHLQSLFKDKKMEIIKNHLLPSCQFYPEAQNIFKVFSMPMNEIKVVILGQDPYFNGTATGLAFAVSESTPYPTSLNVILKEVIKPELSEDFIKFKETNPKWRTLEHWVEQGVFLLNTALTVEVGKAGSHTGVWMWFTREVIKLISIHNPSVWMLWGAKAQSFKEYIATHIIMNEENVEVIAPTNGVLVAPHPAAAAYGNTKTFVGCNHFELCNKILENNQKSIINW